MKVSVDIGSEKRVLVVVVATCNLEGEAQVAGGKSWRRHQGVSLRAHGLNASCITSVNSSLNKLLVSYTQLYQYECFPVINPAVH